MSPRQQQLENIATEHGVDPNTLTVTADGLVVTEDGENIGVITPDEFVAIMPEGTEPPLMTEGLVDWVMSKKLKHEAKKVSATIFYNEAGRKCDELITEAERKAREEVTRSPEYLEALTVVSNAAKIIEAADMTLKVFAGYDSELARYAKANLKKNDGQTLRLAYGSISFRKNPDKIVYDDPAKAIKWAAEFAPDALKQEVQVGKLPKDVVLFLKNPDQLETPKSLQGEYGDVLRIEEGETKVTVSTNIEKVNK